MRITMARLVLTFAIGFSPGGCGSNGDDSGGPKDMTDGEPGIGEVTFDRFLAIAKFYPAGTEPSCMTKKTIDVCQVLSCKAGNAPAHRPDAGNINITGGTQTVTLAPGEDGSYKGVSLTEAFWNGGETLKVTAAGHDVAAFNTDILAPTEAQLTQPSSPSGGALTMDWTTDLVIKWTGAQGGNMRVSFSLHEEHSESEMVCTFPGNPGMGTIPVAALGEIRGSPMSASTVSFDSETHSLVQARNYSVTTRALRGATDSNNQSASYRIAHN